MPDMKLWLNGILIVGFLVFAVTGCIHNCQRPEPKYERGEVIGVFLKEEDGRFGDACVLEFKNAKGKHMVKDISCLNRREYKVGDPYYYKVR